MKKAIYLSLSLLFMSCSQSIPFLVDPYFLTLYGEEKGLQRELSPLKRAGYSLELVQEESIEEVTLMEDLRNSDFRIYSPLASDQFSIIEPQQGKDLFLIPLTQVGEGQVAVLPDRGETFLELGQRIRTWAESKGITRLGGAFWTGDEEVSQEWSLFQQGLGQDGYWEEIPEEFRNAYNRERIQTKIINQQDRGVQAYALFLGSQNSHFWSLVEGRAEYIFTENRKNSGIGQGKVLWSIEDDLTGRILKGLIALEEEDYGIHKVRSKIHPSK